ncbi:MAG TPA: DUF4424 family protein [Allosphingosinicella sp.]|nr:DUF4424 family protein [Allosphingosinicella sp.]
MRPAWIILSGAVLASAPAPAVANDSIAETAAGGLVLKQSADIDMLSENLFVSAEQVRVRYVFRNRSGRDLRLTVAFPMPERDLAAERESDVAFPSDFRTSVDGAPVKTQVERKAMLGGTDHGRTLAGLGMPISPAASGRGIGEALDALPEAERARLVGLGLAEAHEYDAGRGMERHLAPMWTVAETWYWQQLFPAGRDLVVEHSYRPGTGASVSAALAMPDFRASPEGRAMIADYCVDAAFLAALDRLARRAGADYPTLPEQRIGYILTTGANWRSPIGDFRLVVDKGAPANIVSFCGSGVRRIGPTRFEMRRRDWRPDRDLKVLIVQPPPR